MEEEAGNEEREREKGGGGGAGIERLFSGHRSQ